MSIDMTNRRKSWLPPTSRDGQVIVASGNTKLGDIPSVSLLPVVTCDRAAPCCQGGCYARTLCGRAGKTWGHNTELAAKDPATFFSSLRQQFRTRESSGIPAFRWFVGGDFPSRRFLSLTMKFMADHSKTKFLVFTKRYKWMARWLDSHSLPKNVSVVLSSWPGYQIFNPHNLPVVWLQDGTEDRVPADAIPCHGSCEGCGMCWSLPEIGRDVVFTKR